MPLNAEPPAGASAASSPTPLRKSSTRDNFHGGGHSLGRIATKTAIPKTSLRRYLTDVHR